MWTLAVRAIAGIPVDRARLRTTLVYGVRADLQVGVEWNPLADDVGPLANWRVLDETERRPALILGTSSDRIGTPRGRAFYATVSKSLDRELDLPIAPYVGAAYGTYDDELVPIGGVLVQWTESFSTTHLYDGDNVHHLATWPIGEGRSLGIVLAEQDGEYYPGLTFSIGFGR